MENHSLFWIVFNLFVIRILLFDLLVLNRRAHAVKLGEALGWSAFWTTLSLSFNYLMHRTMGHEAGLPWLTGYLIEKALSMDNLFVFLLIFTYFKVPAEYYTASRFGACWGRWCCAATSLWWERRCWRSFIFCSMYCIAGVHGRAHGAERRRRTRN